MVLVTLIFFSGFMWSVYNMEESNLLWYCVHSPVVDDWLSVTAKHQTVIQFGYSLIYIKTLCSLVPVVFYRWRSGVVLMNVGPTVRWTTECKCVGFRFFGLPCWCCCPDYGNPAPPDCLLLCSLYLEEKI